MRSILEAILIGALLALVGLHHANAADLPAPILECGTDAECEQAAAELCAAGDTRWCEDDV